MDISSPPETDALGAPPATPKASWRKARLPVLLASTTAEDALADIVLGCVDHLRGNEACVLQRSHEEGIHQMRVATRRLRSCLALYDRFIPQEQQGHLVSELKWLIGELGPARDWDVFVSDTFAPVVRQLGDEDRLTSLSEHVETLRDEAYARAQAAVGAQRYLGLVLLLHSWGEGRGWRDPADPTRSAAIQVNASDIAHDLMQHIHAQLLAAGEGFENLAAEQRHKVRIQIKKLRYATEFFSTLYPRRKVEPYLAAMKALQDDLGTSNDVDVARKLLKRVIKQTKGKDRARIAYAAGLVVGWHSHVDDNRETTLIRDWTRLASRTPYWEPSRTRRAAVPPALEPAPQPALDADGAASASTGNGEGATGAEPQPPASTRPAATPGEPPASVRRRRTARGLQRR